MVGVELYSYLNPLTGLQTVKTRAVITEIKFANTKCVLVIQSMSEIA